MTVLCFEQIVPFHLYYNIIINIVIIIHYKYYVKETKGSKVHKQVMAITKQKHNKDKHKHVRNIMASTELRSGQLI